MFAKESNWGVYFNQNWCHTEGSNITTTQLNIAPCHQRCIWSGHPTFFNFIDFMIREESAAGKKLVRLRAGNECPEPARCQRNTPRIENNLGSYQNEQTDIAQIGFSYHFHFALYVLFPASLCLLFLPKTLFDIYIFYYLVFFQT